MIKDVGREWVAVHLPTHSEVVARNAHEPHEGCTGNLVVVKVDGNPDIRKAIAELISAAPDLLEALKATETAEDTWANCEECENSGAESPELGCERCFNLADKARLMRRAAIAKAEPQEALEPELCPHGFGFVEYCPDCEKAKGKGVSDG